MKKIKANEEKPNIEEVLIAAMDSNAARHSRLFASVEPRAGEWNTHASRLAAVYGTA